MASGTGTVPASSSNELMMKSHEAIQEQGQNQETEGLSPSTQTVAAGSIGLNPLVARLPIGIDIALPVPGFKVRNLIALADGKVIGTRWGHGDDLPLSAGSVQLAWCEFEVMESRLAVRITRLA
jgi:flagellar motor switch protein FliM